MESVSRGVRGVCEGEGWKGRIDSRYSETEVLVELFSVALSQRGRRSDQGRAGGQDTYDRATKQNEMQDEMVRCYGRQLDSDRPRHDGGLT